MAVRKHGTLVISTVADVALARADTETTIPSSATGNTTTKHRVGGIGAVEVLSRGANEIFFTVDGSTPTVGGDDTHVATARIPARVSVPRTEAITVKLISSAAAPYSVSAF
jgi:hypothetical protein